ncbi:hypothetical protein ACLKMY_21140 [Paraburkholderia mimosarum]|uniref:hypothetical protein n=1 Tax=Paraburkholderia mimosarum TaxID=312026 RepID=UPI0039C280A3
MDDLPDKLRRNVVVLSAAIVAITVFHLTFRPTGTLLGFAEVGRVTPVKIWLALSAVLAYMFLRYWFYEGTDQERALLVQEFQGRRYAMVKRHLERALERHLIHRRAPACLTDIGNFPDAQLAVCLADRGPPIRADAVATVEADQHSPWRGRVGYTFDLQWSSGNHYSSSGGQRFDFRLRRCVALWTVLRCVLGTATYSKSAVDVLVPIALAGVAAIMCLYQLVIAGFQLGS